MEGVFQALENTLDNQLLTVKQSTLITSKTPNIIVLHLIYNL